jgi:hypothetical protein
VCVKPPRLGSYVSLTGRTAGERLDKRPRMVVNQMSSDEKKIRDALRRAFQGPLRLTKETEDKIVKHRLKGKGK